jgi:hypothetical protein
MDEKGATSLKMTAASDGTETYTNAAVKPTPPTVDAIAVPSSALPPQFVLEEDDLSVAVPPGTKCQRKGCDKVFISNEESRTGDGASAQCYYHPAPVGGFKFASSAILIIFSPYLEKVARQVLRILEHKDRDLIDCRGIYAVKSAF